MLLTSILLGLFTGVYAKKVQINLMSGETFELPNFDSATLEGVRNFLAHNVGEDQSLVKLYSEGQEVNTETFAQLQQQSEDLYLLAVISVDRFQELLTRIEYKTSCDNEPWGRPKDYMRSWEKGSIWVDNADERDNIEFNIHETQGKFILTFSIEEEPGSHCDWEIVDSSESEYDEGRLENRVFAKMTFMMQDGTYTDNKTVGVQDGQTYDITVNSSDGKVTVIERGGKMYFFQGVHKIVLDVGHSYDQCLEYYLEWTEIPKSW